MGSDRGDKLKDSKGRGRANIMQDGTIDLQHGTGIEWSKATTPSKGFYIWRSTYLNSYILHCLFFSSVGKNKPCEVAMNMHFFMGLLTWLRTILVRDSAEFKN